MSVGDTVTFNWKAANGADAFDVYAYLLNTADGSTIELLDETADGSTEFAPANVTVSAAGDYKFVFVSAHLITLLEEYSAQAFILTISMLKQQMAQKWLLNISTLGIKRVQILQSVY